MDFENSTVINNNLTLESGEPVAVPRWCELILCTFLLISAILAIGGNSLILIVEIKNKFKTSTDWLVFFISANDFLFAVFNIPIYVIYHLGYWQMIASDITCKVHYFLEAVTMLSSTLMLTIVAIDRFFKTCKPHGRYITQVRAFRACLIITAVAFIVNIPVIITMEKNDQFCVYKAGSAFAFIVHALLIITYMALSIVVCVAYAKVAQAIRTKLHLGRCPATDVTMKATQTSSSETRSSIGGLKLTKIKIGTKKASINKVAPLNVAVMGLNQHGKNDVKTGDQKRESLLVPGNSPKPKDTNSPRGQWFTSTQSSKANRDIGCKKSTISLKQGAFLSHKTTRKVDRTTRIMFAVTLVFLLSWIPTWVTYVYREMTRNQRAEVGGKVAILFGGKLFIINTFANPFFYIWMSSVFKERAKKALKSICIPCT